MMFIQGQDVIETMRQVTHVIYGVRHSPDVYSLGGIGILIVHATGMANAGNGCAQTSYELLDELEAEEYMKEV